ncbi:PI-PLC domain-containing protein [Mucilaginibacter paludis]|uniref:Altered inheritance of mitochondria protein 6 n=1 Tax=Mucilaginibacter paludis DSM 18603 TaxID=714943 RepID=H1Y882_9SPHI|nr:hypothetical protein [Mucilaginibacter paludis]EHQ24901.1 hypothetical protein Mucpa_0720 [Mucilaginibacter paludis DSM 18603]
MYYKHLLSLFFALFACCSLTAQVKPIVRAHAHNDYMHTHPLKDALALGFTSVEADIYLINGELFVSHERPEKTNPLKTLKSLYLDPLQKIMQANNNRVYKNYDGIFYLMIDIKSDSLHTYQALKAQILGYPEFLHNPHFKIYLTSFEDLHFVLKDKASIAGIDGRLADTKKGYSLAQVPVISEAFKTITHWNGKDTITENQYNQVKAFITQVHRDGKKCRLWAIPDQPEVWRRLLNDGMDFINTDKLQEFNQFIQMNPTF